MKIGFGKLNEKQVLGITIAAIIIPIVALGYLLYRDMKNYKATANDIETLQGQKKDLEDKVVKIPGLKQLDAAYQQYNDKIWLRQMPKSFNNAEFLVVIHDLAKQAKVDIDQDIRYVAVETKGSVRIIDFNLTIKGEYKRIMGFLNLLERYERVIRVISFNLSLNPDKKTYTCIIGTAKTFAYGTPKPAAAAPAPGAPPTMPGAPAPAAKTN